MVNCRWTSRLDDSANLRVISPGAPLASAMGEATDVEYRIDWPRNHETERSHAERSEPDDPKADDDG